MRVESESDQGGRRSILVPGSLGMAQENHVRDELLAKNVKGCVILGLRSPERMFYPECSNQASTYSAKRTIRQVYGRYL